MNKIKEIWRIFRMSKAEAAQEAKNRQLNLIIHGISVSLPMPPYYYGYKTIPHKNLFLSKGNNTD